MKRTLMSLAILVLAALVTWADTHCWATDLSDGLVGLWRFDASDGKTAKDLSPRNQPAAIEDARLCREKGTTSLEFDGFGGHLLVGSDSLFKFSSALTASVWIKPFQLRDRTVLFGVPHANDSWTTPMYGMYAVSNRAVFGLWGSPGVSKTLVESEGDLPLGTWSLLTGTFDGTMARFYVNGRLSAEKPHAGTIVENGRPLIVGKGLGYAKPCLRGRIGELRLYARALSAGEVRSLFEETKSAFDLSMPPQPAPVDGLVTVETHGSSPAGQSDWRKQPTRLLETLQGYRSQAAGVRLDRYGGWLDRPKEKATGFFRVQKIGDRYWLVDPEGCRFFNVGMNTLREPRDVAANFGSAEKWATIVTSELRENGFTSYTGTPLRHAVASPLVRVVWPRFMFSFAKQLGLTEPAAGTVGFHDRCMPVFHPEFPAFCENVAKELAATADDPAVLGIMTDNELQCAVDLLDRHLALDAANPNLKPGREAAVAWLRAHKGSADAAAITLRDRYQFIAFAFDRYYALVTAAIRRYDRNHLYLGSRINYRQGQFDNPWFWKMLARYHDVVSVNYYHYWGPQKAQFAEWEQWSGKPVMITEWYAKAMDAPGLANTHGAGWLVRTQEDRARYYQHFALNALETKSIVGWNWFKYLDDPKESKALDNAGGANKGMFDASGRPYRPLIDAARAVNREVYPLIEFFDRRNRR